MNSVSLCWRLFRSQGTSILLPCPGHLLANKQQLYGCTSKPMSPKEDAEWCITEFLLHCWLDEWKAIQAVVKLCQLSACVPLSQQVEEENQGDS